VDHTLRTTFFNRDALPKPATLAALRRDCGRVHVVLTIGASQRQFPVSRCVLARFESLRDVVQRELRRDFAHACTVEPIPVLRRLAWRESVRAAFQSGRAAA
jgi:hypothetical protein